MREVRFNLNISREKYHQLLQDQIKAVIVTTHNGRRIQFATHHLRQFLTQTGIHGQFRIVFSDKNKMIRMERISA